MVAQVKEVTLLVCLVLLPLPAIVMDWQMW